MKINLIHFKKYFLLCGVIFLLSFSKNAFALDPASGPVELNGDVVEYSVDGNKITARGHVVLIHSQATLMCDQVDFYRDKKVAYAEGNVRLISKQGEISGNNCRLILGP